MTRGRHAMAPHAVLARIPLQRQYSGEIADDVHKIGVRGNDDFCISLKRRLRRLQSLQQLRIPDEVLVRRLVDKPDRLRLAFGLKNSRLPDAFRLFDFSPLGSKMESRKTSAST